MLLKAPVPWSVADLDNPEEVITATFCATYWPGCEQYEVLDWIRALTPKDREQVIALRNTSRGSSHQV